MGVCERCGLERRFRAAWDEGDSRRKGLYLGRLFEDINARLRLALGPIGGW